MSEREALIAGANCAFTDKEAAVRLLDRHAREVAAHFDAENLHSVEDLMKMPIRRWLELIVKYDTDEPVNCEG